MKKTNLIILAIAMLAMNSCSNSDKKESSTVAVIDSASKMNEQPAVMEAPMDSAAAAKAWEMYMMPGEMHKWMAAGDGKWDAELTFWMAPDAPPTPASKASMENRMILGGRYQQTVYKGNMMGMPFEGQGIMAYDNAKKKFISTWIDNMGTGLMHLEGDYDEASKTLNLNGTMVDATNGKDKPVRQVLRMVDEKNQVLELFDNFMGKEFKSMEIKLTRK